ncbi:HNH endonuclease [Deinococcus aquaticus]|uniref:HNH endonuclease n=1 Tax=Deinococcus aquaticus TaxID=328692 RepID=A0ABY7UWS3_9DEIO|nr:HNH endonuclease [Deinococcus aquaticus]WDA57330.1 HNH endonuclease [Deinococcus aquaticus]
MKFSSGISTMIRIDFVDKEELFADEDKTTIAKVVKLGLSAREMWSHEDIQPILAKIKGKLLIKQRSCCFYCQRALLELTREDWQIDHIVSINEDDRHVFTSANLVLSCKWCNRNKSGERIINRIPSSNKYSLSSSNYKIVHPRLDRYSDHIEIIGGFYVGRKGKGKKTKEVCNLDRIALDFLTGLETDDKEFFHASMSLLMSNNPKSLIVFLRNYDKENANI